MLFLLFLVVKCCITLVHQFLLGTVPKVDFFFFKCVIGFLSVTANTLIPRFLQPMCHVELGLWKFSFGHCITALLKIVQNMDHNPVLTR